MSELVELSKIDAETWATINQFVEYLNEKGVWLARYFKFGDKEWSWEDMHPIDFQEKQKLLYGFFDTTPEDCERERRLILENIRKRQREEAEACKK